LFQLININIYIVDKLIVLIY